MIPCIEDKCLKYPVCKSKSEIVCRALNDYFREIEMESDQGKAWTIVQKDLPNISFIKLPVGAF